VEETLARVPNREAGSVQEILQIDELSRTAARSIVSERADGAGVPDQSSGALQAHGRYSIEA